MIVPYLPDEGRESSEDNKGDEGPPSLSPADDQPPLTLLAAPPSAASDITAPHPGSPLAYGRASGTPMHGILKKARTTPMPPPPSDASAVSEPDAKRQKSEPSGDGLVTEMRQALMNHPFVAFPDTEHQAVPHRKVYMTRKEQKALDREIPYHKIPEDQKEGYREALMKEWGTWMKYEAVKILDNEASAFVEQHVDPSRILATRVCYRNKNAAFPWLPIKYKARIVCRGDQDPDLLTLRRDAPTMTRLSLMLILQIAASQTGWFMFNADITGAFLQGDQSLSSRKEALYLRQPREGLPGVGRDQIMLVTRGIFGLANSPRLFWRHLRDTLLSLGFRQCSMDKALFMYYTDGRLVLTLGAHVDDLVGTGMPDVADKILDKLRSIFDFGAWANDRTEEVLEYGGKQITRSNGVIKLSQQKYIQATTLSSVPKWRTATPNASLLPSERSELKSVGGCLHWMVGQTRPDLAAGTSLYMSGEPTVSNLLDLNKLLKEAKNSDDWGITFRYIDLYTAKILVYSDSSWANAEELKSQAGFCVFMVGQHVESPEGDAASLLDWRSHRIKRQCRSTLAAETMAMDAAMDSGTFTQEQLAEMLIESYVPTFSGKLPPTFMPVVAVTDCRSLFDLLVKDGPPATTQEKRLVIDINGLKEAALEYDAEGEKLRETFKWVATESQVADHLTKVKPARMLRDLLSAGRLTLVKIESSDGDSHHF